MLGKRVLFATGGRQVDGLVSSSDVLADADGRRNDILTRADMSFHHGQAATVAAALRAGRPSAIFPASSEGRFWAGRVHDLGAGPPPGNVKRLSVEGIASTMRAMDTSFVREKVRKLRSQMRSEGGLDDAVRVIDRLMRVERRPENDGNSAHGN